MGGGGLDNVAQEVLFAIWHGEVLRMHLEGVTGGTCAPHLTRSQYTGQHASHLGLLSRRARRALQCSLEGRAHTMLTLSRPHSQGPPCPANPCCHLCCHEAVQRQAQGAATGLAHRHRMPLQQGSSSLPGGTERTAALTAQQPQRQRCLGVQGRLTHLSSSFLCAVRATPLISRPLASFCWTDCAAATSPSPCSTKRVLSCKVGRSAQEGECTLLNRAHSPSYTDRAADNLSASAWQEKKELLNSFITYSITVQGMLAEREGLARCSPPERWCRMLPTTLLSTAGSSCSTRPAGERAARRCSTFSASCVASNSGFCRLTGTGSALCHASTHVLPGSCIRSLRCPLAHCREDKCSPSVSVVWSPPSGTSAYPWL